MDGAPGPAQRQVLEQLWRRLQIPQRSFQRLEQTIQLQARIFGRADPGRAERPGSRHASPQAAIAGAYAVLGIAPKATDAEVTRAYRKLMNRHHPDKAMSRGLPEEAVKLASQKTLEVRRAYETITRARAAA